MWKHDDAQMILMDDRNDSIRFLDYMVTQDGRHLPLKQYQKWTLAEVVARCRNLAEQSNRRLDHGTGVCTRHYNCGEEDTYYEL